MRGKVKVGTCVPAFGDKEKEQVWEGQRPRGWVMSRRWVDQAPGAAVWSGLDSGLGF